MNNRLNEINLFLQCKQLQAWFMYDLVQKCSEIWSVSRLLTGLLTGLDGCGTGGLGSSGWFVPVMNERYISDMQQRILHNLSVLVMENITTST